MDSIKIKISSEYSNITIKEFLKKHNVGRGKVEAIRVSKQTYINNEYAHLDKLLRENDILEIGIDEQIDHAITKAKLDVIYEDEYVIIVNKPTNMIIHNDDKEKGGSLANLVANYYKENNINRKVRYLHRIDKETTGLIMFAKDFLTEGVLLKDFETHSVKRTYLAFVEGKFSQKTGTIKANIGIDRHKNGKMCISKTGKEAITTYEVVKTYKDYSLVKYQLKTGRTHQIRVHSEYIKHPLLGDVLYGGNMQYINRVALHSYEIEFIHPITKNKVNVTCGLPLDMKVLNKQ